jgi:hypothetical protein
MIQGEKASSGKSWKDEKKKLFKNHIRNRSGSLVNILR